MSTQSARQLYNKFIRGLITEATELNFPPDAATVLNNFNLNAKGDAVRRAGVTFETGHAWRDLGTPNYTAVDVFQMYRWRNVEGQGDKDHIIVQQGDVLHFFTNVTDTITDEWDSSMTINLSAHQVTGATANQLSYNPCSFTVGNGKLYINHKYTLTIEVTHITGAPDTISAVSSEVQIRDFVGEDDGFANDGKPTTGTMNNSHWYNLCNQGWVDHLLDVSAVLSSRSSYPSNAEQWQYGKYTNVSTGQEVWSYTHFAQQSFGNTRAPRGHYIINAFDKNVTIPTASTFQVSSYGAVAAGVVTINTVAAHGLITGDTVSIVSPTNTTYDNGGGCPGVAWEPDTDITGTITVTGANQFTVATTSGLPGWLGWCAPAATDNYGYKSATVAVTNPLNTRPQSNAFYAGRLFQSGVEEDGYNGHVYFSQIIQGDDMYNLCYQDADPTSEHSNSLVATDGGVIIIPDMQICRKMQPYAKGLLLFADNGVWYISGSETEFFTAESYSVDKVTDVGIISAKSMVLADNTPHYWSKDGIYQISIDEVTGKPKATSLTQNTIQTFYDDIPEARKNTVRGAYNTKTKKLIWVYEDELRGSPENVRNLAIVLDLRTKGFFPWTIDDTSYHIIDVVDMPDYTTNKDQIWKFLIRNQSTSYFGAADLGNTDFEDWDLYDAAAEMQTGDVFVTDPAVEKQIRQMTAYFRRTEEAYVTDGAGGAILNKQSSCIMQPIWDWSDHTNSGKYGNAREIYRFRRPYIGGGVGSNFDNGYPVTITKNKIRGSGKAVRFKLTTTAGKDCQLLGWSNNFDSRTTE